MPSHGSILTFLFLLLVTIPQSCSKDSSGGGATCTSDWVAKSTKNTLNNNDVYFCCPTNSSAAVSWIKNLGPLCCNSPSSGGRMDCDSALKENHQDVVLSCPHTWKTYAYPGGLGYCGSDGVKLSARWISVVVALTVTAASLWL